MQDTKANQRLLKTTGRKKAGKSNIPGWNSVVKSKQQNCQGSLLAMGKLQ